MDEVEEIITFDYIREAYIAEKNENKLSKLPEGFFKKVSKYLRLKEEIIKNTNDEKVRYELKNIRKIVDEIMILRLKKIIDAVFVFLKNGTLVSNMIPEEEEIFFKFIDLIKEHRKCLLEKNENLKIVSNSSTSIKFDIAEEKTEKSNYVEGNLKIKILTSIPKFVTSDGKSYGPFEEGSIIEIESEIANSLIEAGLAEKVNI